jgi:hypothetical protein
MEQGKQNVMFVEDAARRRNARTRLKTALEHGLVEVGDKTWSRDELYDRRAMSGRRVHGLNPPTSSA